MFIFNFLVSFLGGGERVAVEDSAFCIHDFLRNNILK
jgi:hypothetical protein